MIESRRGWFCLIWGGYALMCLAMAMHLHWYPSDVEYADARGYLDFAIVSRTAGLLGPLLPSRTYGYVWFLHFCSLLSGTGRQALIATAVSVQALLFGWAVYLLTAAIARRSLPLARAVALGLLLNPILVALIMDTLTEGITLITVLFLIYILLRAATAPGFAEKLPWLIGGAALAGVSLVIRPANLSVLIGWNVAVLAILIAAGIRSAPKRVLMYGAATAIVSLLVWAPQLVITHRVSGHASIIPPSLGDFQTITGLRMIKYATLVNPSHVAYGMAYPNPWLREIPDAEPLRWYITHPALGALIGASHLFNAMNYDHPFVYVYNSALPYSIPLAFICWVIYSLALVDVILVLRRWRELHAGLPEFVPATALLVFVSAMTLAIISVSAVESRYSTLIFALAGVLACHLLLRAKAFPASMRFVTAVTAIFIGIFGVLISEWMKALVQLG